MMKKREAPAAKGALALRGGVKANLMDDTEKEIVRLYTDERLGHKLIGQRLGISCGKARCLLTRIGLWGTVQIPRRGMKGKGFQRWAGKTLEQHQESAWKAEWKGVWPDWSYEWTKERATRRSCIKYHAMTQAERDAVNSAYYFNNKNRLREGARDWKRRNPEKSNAFNRASARRWRKRNPDKVRAIRRERETRGREALSDKYIKKAIRHGTSIPASMIPAPLIELKRAHMILKRQLKEQTT